MDRRTLGTVAAAGVAGLVLPGGSVDAFTCEADVQRMAQEPGVCQPDGVEAPAVVFDEHAIHVGADDDHGIDDVRVDRRALAADELAALATGERPSARR